MKRKISIIAGISCYLLLFLSLSFAKQHVLVEGDLFSINAKSVSLETILSELHQKTGIVFTFDDQVGHEIISLKLEKQTLDKVLARLLKSYGQILMYGKNGSIDKIQIFKKDEKAGTLADRPNAVSNDKPIWTPPSELDPKMDIVDIGGEELMLDDPISSTGSDTGMEIIDSPEGEMEVILPERSNEVKTKTSIE